MRYHNDALLITYKTLNKDNPRLNCRIEGFQKFSPKRIILDNLLETRLSSYIIKTASSNNTIIFYNKADKAKISLFKKKGILIIKSPIIKNKGFDIKKILKKLYLLGCRNLLVEGGNQLNKSMLIKKYFNQFYLFKSPKKLSKVVDYKEFKNFKELSQNYKFKAKINTELGKDVITIYRK